MDKNKAARNSCNYHRANGYGNKAKASIAEYERATQIAGWMFGLSFGLMFFVGLI